MHVFKSKKLKKSKKSKKSRVKSPKFRVVTKSKKTVKPKKAVGSKIVKVNEKDLWLYLANRKYNNEK